MKSEDITEMIYNALRLSTDKRIDDVTMDGGDHCEIIITVIDKSGNKQDWILSSKDIRNITP